MEEDSDLHVFTPHSQIYLVLNVPALSHEKRIERLFFFKPENVVSTLELKIQSKFQKI